MLSLGFEMKIQLVPSAGHPNFLDLPWQSPLEEWPPETFVSVARGISRHVVRFVEREGAVYALKELPQRLAGREYRLLRDLARNGIPVVAAFFWGDCSLSNTLFRRDAGALSAYLVDAETGELHPELTEGQRRHDLDIAEENVIGELFDLEAELGEPSGRDPFVVAAEIRARYERLWAELTAEELFAAGERHRLEERLRRLNELGFDVDEVEVVAGPQGYRLRLR